MKEIKEKIENLAKTLQQLSSRLRIKEQKKTLNYLEQKIKKPGFWQREKAPGKIQERFADLKEKIEKINALEKEIEDLKQLSPLIKENTSEEKELKDKVAKLSSAIKDYGRQIFLGGRYDKGAAILSIQAGAGGRDAEDWAAMLRRMYERYSEKKKWTFKILSESFTEGGGPEGRIGVKEVSMKIKGKFSYGLLKNETGVHRLVRISPFSAKGLRHTSFAKVEVLPEIKESEAEIKIRPEDLKIETFRASGPGGQYVNRRESAVRITHLPTGLRASSQAERLQGLNRKIAMQVLLAKLVRLQEKEKQKQIEKIKASQEGRAEGEKISPEFGQQTRSYVFHPYKLVKDHRTGVETSDVEAVLDGDLDRFIEAEIRM